jgi:hypothetical protein
MPISQWDEVYYPTNRPVVKASGTTRVRPMLDASVREQGHPSLNHCLQKGTNFMEIILPLLLRFWLHQIGAIADLRKQFLQINLYKYFLRILRVNEEKALKIFRLICMPLGVNSSPFLLGDVIDFHLKSHCERFKERIQYARDTGEKLRKSFYVDQCVTSLKE